MRHKCIAKLSCVRVILPFGISKTKNKSELVKTYLLYIYKILETEMSLSNVSCLNTVNLLALTTFRNIFEIIKINNFFVIKMCVIFTKEDYL